MRALAPEERAPVKLTYEQEEALRLIKAWLGAGDSSNWMFYLGGFAGTGKTTLMHHFINSLDRAPHCLAPTGKAASVLMKKLNGIRVRTIHSMLYKPVEKSRARLFMLQMDLNKDPDNLRLKFQIVQEQRKLAREKISFVDQDEVGIMPHELVIVDEASMVTQKMLCDLEKTGAKVLFVGDPGQLPPVKDAGHFSRAEPDAMLKSVQRQALDNPIIKLSMDIRNSNPIQKNIKNEAIIRMPKSKFNLDGLTAYDQILCGMNIMRRKINRMVRKQTVLTGDETKVYPVIGEKLICLRNRPFDTAEHGRIWLINGEMCESTGAAFMDEMFGDATMLPVKYDGLDVNFPINPFHFDVTYNPSLEEPLEADDNRRFVELDYGYAITVHKSQGSEWNRVLLVDDEMNVNNRSVRKRWLYTAVTRAKEQLTWLTND